MPHSDSQAEIEALLEQADQLPYGPEELAIVRQAAELATEAGEEDLEYLARMHLTDSASMVGDTDTKLSSFAWCLAKHDSDPDRFPLQIDAGSDLMWQYKWMCGSTNRSPAFPLDQIRALLDDMEARYRQSGLGLSAVISERFDHAWTTGQLEEAKRLRTVLEATPRDDYSDCEACARSQQAGFAAELGEDARALKLIDEITGQGLSCADEPEFALARTLLPMLRAGRFDDAKANHLRSYQLARLDPDNSSIVAANLSFCAITGNQARALAMVERHLPWLVHDALNSAARLELLAAIGLALESVERIGHGDQLVRGADRPELAALLNLDDAAGPWTVQNLAPKVWASALALAEAFDARNGNLFASGKLGDQKALFDNPFDLPIQSNAFVTAPTPPAEPDTVPELLEAALSFQALGQPQRTADLADRVLRLTTAHGDASCANGIGGVENGVYGPGSKAQERSLDGVGRTAAMGGVDGAGGVDRVASTETVDGPCQVRGLDDDPRLTAHRLKIGSLVALERLDESRTALDERLTALRDLGLGDRAEVESLAGLALYSPDRDGGIDTLRVALGRASEADDQNQAEAWIARKLALALINGEDAGTHTDEVEALLDRVDAKAVPGSFDQVAAWATRSNWRSEAPEPVIEGMTRCLDADLPAGQRYAYLRSRANAYGAAGRFAEGLADADQATRIAAALGAGKAGARAAELAGLLAMDAEQHQEAASRFRYAVRLDELESNRTPSAKFHLARLLYQLDQDLEAAELFADVLELETAARADAAAIAATLEWLGRAREATGQWGAALQAWQQGAQAYCDAGRPSDAAQVRWRIGNLLRRAEDWEAAVAEFDAGIELLEEADWRAQQDLHQVGMTVLEARALAKAELGQDEAIADVDLARSVALADEAAWRAADLIDTRARVLFVLERPEEAVAHFLQAADAYRAASDPLAGARAELLAANVLSGSLSRPDEARGLLEATLRDLGGLAAASSKEVAEGTAGDVAGLTEAVQAALAELA
ncbi:MAG: hypothetical protein LBK95_06170 [Bifidobacteriaceae bacterium]|jgi:tetratricopeptide (TPR) repeat protein|nr:hypothetical protein [Bifidobacteriaceae bacterium]